MAVHWGVDSWNRATDLVGKTGQTFWDWVTATYNRSPEFWARYMNGGGGRPVLAQAEVQFLLAKNCRILPIVVPNPARMQVGGRQGWANGMRSGNTTLELADNLRMPADVFIYVDIESGDRPSMEWLDGWTDMMEFSKYGGSGGFYCSPKNPNFSVPYGNLLNKFPIWKQTKQSHRSVWSVTPYRGNCKEIPSAFSADSPDSDPGVAAVWQYAINCHGGRIDLNLANDDGFAVMWGGQAPAARQKPNQGTVVATPVGRWEVYVGVWTWNYIFRADNTVLWSDITQPSVIQPGTGTWSMEGSRMKITWSHTDGTVSSVEEWRLPLSAQITAGELVGQGPIIEARQLSDVPQ